MQYKPPYAGWFCCGAAATGRCRISPLCYAASPIYQPCPTTYVQNPVLECIAPGCRARRCCRGRARCRSASETLCTRVRNSLQSPAVTCTAPWSAAATGSAVAMCAAALEPVGYPTLTSIVPARSGRRRCQGRALCCGVLCGGRAAGWATAARYASCCTTAWSTPTPRTASSCWPPSSPPGALTRVRKQEEYWMRPEKLCMMSCLPVQLTSRHALAHLKACVMS